MANIAIIDDIPDNADVLGIMLRQYGHAATSFASGSDFLEAFKATPFDIILLDIAMPDANGYEVFDMIRKVNPDVPIVAVTAHAYPEDQKKVMRHGFTDYFSKPIVDFDKFCERLVSHITSAKKG